MGYEFLHRSFFFKEKVFFKNMFCSLTTLDYSVKGYALRVAGYALRVAGYALRVTIKIQVLHP